MTSRKILIGLVGSTLRNAVALLAVFSMAATLAHAATEAAKINDKVINMDEFERKFRENLQFFQLRKPTRASVIEDMVKRELGIQEARKLGLDKDADVQDRMNTVLYQALLEKKLGKDVEKIYVSESDAKDYYEKYPEIRTSHIFVAVPPDAPADKEKLALDRIKEIQEKYLKPGDLSFAEVAQKYSEGMAAPMGGDLDYQGRDKLDPTFYQAALGLKTPGKVSGIVRSQFGFHIIKLTGIRPWNEADHVQTKRLVFEEKRRELFEKYMTDLRSKAKVVINPTLLKQGG